MIELPKRIGNISDTDYLQEQINSMKHQLDNSVGGSTTTIANLSVENLEVKGKIDMGKNTAISWLNIKDADDVATQESIDATKEVIKEVEEMAKNAQSTANSALGAIPTNYIPYSTYIDGRKVITESIAANNLLIKGGSIDIETGGANVDVVNLNHNKISNGIYEHEGSFSPYRIAFRTAYSNGLNHHFADLGSTGLAIRMYGPSGNQMYEASLGPTGSTIQGRQILTQGDSVSDATNATYAQYGYHTNMTSNMYVGVNQAHSGNYRSFGYCGRTDFSTWLEGSSIRYKHDVKLLSPDWLEQIHKLYDLKVKSWTFNEDHLNPEDDQQGKELIGIIAEELEEVMPNAVLHDKDGNVTSYSDRVLLNAMLVLLQEQNKRIEELERRLQVEPVE